MIMKTIVEFIKSNSIITVYKDCGFCKFVDGNNNTIELVHTDKSMLDESKLLVSRGYSINYINRDECDYIFNEWVRKMLGQSKHICTTVFNEGNLVRVNRFYMHDMCCEIETSNMTILDGLPKETQLKSRFIMPANQVFSIIGEYCNYGHKFAFRNLEEFPRLR